MRDFDWSGTPLGAAETWPQSLRSIHGICLNSAAPIAVFWGPEHVLLCNDAWSALCGDKSPWACGRPAREVWPETWSQLGPRLASVRERGEGTRLPREFMLLQELPSQGGEAALSPIPGDGGKTAGIFVTLIETARTAADHPPSSLPRALAERMATAAGAAIGAAYAHHKQRLWQPGRQAVLDLALNEVHEAIYLINTDGQFVYVNDEAVRTLGYSRGALLSMGVPDIDPDFPIERWRAMQADIQVGGQERTPTAPFETKHVTRDGRVFPVEITASLIEHSGVVYFLSLVRDITERKRAERQRLAHMRFLESMDRINQVIQGASDLEQMMGEALGVTLDVFDCDRAFLLHPCDPSAASHRVPMERTRPEFPGAGAAKAEIPGDAEISRMLRAALEAEGPVKYGPREREPLPPEASVRFHIKSQMAMAIYPKVGAPWFFGVHQCSCPREWTVEEEQLLEKIGRRLSDAVTSLLAHRNLCQSEARLKEAQRIVHLGDWALELETQTLTWSDEVYRILELDPAAHPASHATFFLVIHPDDRAYVEHNCAHIQESGGACDLVYRLLMKDGRVKYVHAQWTTVHNADGAPLRRVGTILDITRAKQTEEALRLSEERYRSMVEATSTIVWITSAEGKVVQDNPSWRAFSGQTYDEIQGDGWLDAVHPEDRAGTVAVWRNAVETHKPFQAPNRVLRHDGDYRYVMVAGVPVLEKDGAVREWIGTCTDVTDQVRAKKEAERYRKHLESEIIERQRAEAALFQAQKMEAIGQLTGGVAHDFNNLLTAITGNLDLLRQRLPQDPAAQRYARNALAAVERAAGVTSQLLAFSRSRRLESRAIDVNEVVRGMLGMLRQTLGEGVKLEQKLAPSLWQAKADRHQLETALLNLVINARDAMPDGGVLTICTDNIEWSAGQSGGVVLECVKPLAPPPELASGRYVVLTVSDTGHGVPAELASRIFEPFVTTKDVGKGTGLGLAMVYGFAKQSGGCVGLESEEGRGAAFSIYLPYTDAVASPVVVEDQTLAELDDASSNTGVILVVEDESHVREMAAMALASFGYDVVEAADAVEALALLEQRPDIELVFTDLVMPRGNGVELAKTICRRWPHLAILLTTGYTQTRAETELPPGIELLMKPYRPAQLGEKVFALLARKREKGSSLSRGVRE